MKNFEDVIGLESLKLELNRILDIMKNEEKYKSLGVGLPRNFLIFGEPGIGKTLVATKFMEASGWNTYVCRKTLSDGAFVNKIVEVFDQAKQNQPAVILLDDLDKFANEDKFHRDTDEYVAVQSCIDSSSKEKIFVIATVNEIAKLPDSLLRAGRFDNKYEINYPKGKEAEQLVSYFLKNKKVSEDVNAGEIAKILTCCSSAQLEAVINEAGVYAGYENKEKIDLDDIIKACMKLLFHAPECLDEAQQEYIEQTAYHEAGHAVVAEHFKKGTVNILSVCKHDSDIGGITSIDRDEGYFFSKQLMENHVMMLLAGKAATELVYGVTDVGANSDLQRAYKIVIRFVDDYCSYGFDRFEFQRDKSNELLGRRENLVFTEMEKYYQQAKKILIENRSFLDALAKNLVTKKTISSHDISSIRESVYGKGE